MPSTLTDIAPLLLIDTREPDPSPWEASFTTPSVRAKLDCGDYSVCGLEETISIERKSFPDLISSLTHQRERFEKELRRARPYNFFAVVVEGSLDDIISGRFGVSRANPEAIFQSVTAFSIRYCPFFFCGNQRTAAKFAESLLLKYAREAAKAVDTMRIAGRKAFKSAENY